MLVSNNVTIMGMSYKYPVMKNLANWIREEKIPSDLDIEEVFKFWMKHHDSPRTKRYEPWKNKPRFYNRALTANGRAKRFGAEGRLSADDLEAVYSQHNGKCKNCNTGNNLVFDHIKPYYRGGTNTVENLQLLCRLCNMEKGVNE
jgi:hypothetical protein